MPLEERDEVLLSRYLLGEDIGDERERIEERFFADDDYFEAVYVLEEALIDDYVCGRLPRPQREQFESRLAASDDWQQRVEFSRRLLDAARTTRSSSGVKWPWLQRLVAGSPGIGRPDLSHAALAAACVAVAIAGILAVRTRQFAARLDRSQFEQQELRESLSALLAVQRERADGLAAQLRDAEQRIESLQSAGSSAAATTPVAARPAVVSFALVSGLVRGGGLPTLAVPAGAAVRLQLDLPDGAPRPPFRAILADSSQRLVWSGDVSSIERVVRPSVLVEVTPGLLLDDEYTLTLRQAADAFQPEDLAYHFAVVPRP